MKKFAAVALALILALSTMFATVAVAANGEETVSSNKLAFAGFEIKDKGVVVDVENMTIYGLKPLLSKEVLEADYLAAGAGFSMDAPNFIGTGSQIVLEKDGVKYPFTVIIYGDLTGDSAIDVIDAAQAQRIHTGKVTPTELAIIAGDADKDGEITVDDYASQVNAAVGNKAVDQNATGSEKEGTLDVADQVYTSTDINDYKAVLDEDVSLTFNKVEIDANHYEIGDCEYVNRDGEFFGTVEITGKGLFSGTVVVEFKVVSLLEKVVATVNEVIEDANLANVVKAKYEVVDGVADIKVEVNASNIIRGNFDVEMDGLNGLLTKIDDFKARYLQDASLTVGDLAIATNGDFDRSAIKALVFDIAKGIFCDIANADDNVVKSYSGALVTNNDLVHLTENFDIDVVMTGNGYDIDRVKAFATKISRYVAFDVVDGNAVIDITMPAAFSTKVVDVLGDGDVDAATAMFNSLTVDNGLELLSLVNADDISAASAAEINQLINVVSGLDALVDKALDEVVDAKATDINGNEYELLNGASFVIADEENRFGAIVNAIRNVANNEILGASIGAFEKDGVYTAEFDVTLDYRNISEKVIVNLDLFGAAETPDVIEETAAYFSDIIAELGLANIAAVSYDAENGRALATLNARELATNLTLNEDAFEGLYTEIKGYFDDNYGTSTIVVGGKEIVTNGKINKSALKDLIFTAATGFFQDAANLGENNVLRSFNTVVTEADGTVHNFDLDFALAGSQADVERVASIAAKVADYVSFEVVEGNAVVNVGLPAGMRNTIVDVFGDGDQAAAIELLNSLTLDQAFDLLAYMDAEHISAANAKDIEAMVSLICSVDNIINKVLNKVTSATATTVNGATYGLLSGADFVVDGDDFNALVKALKAQLGNELKGIKVSDFVNADGTYTAKFDVAISIGGIKETVILNLDVFGDIEEKNAIEDTVDYVGDIFADLGVSNFAAVELKDGKAVATFNASELVANGLNFNDEALDGLFTDIKDYFYANYSDSTITVGGFELVTDGKINKPAVKDFIFDFATGFFTDIANMDAATIRSYNTVVVDAEGNVEEFAFDFNLEGKEAHIEKIQTIASKIAAHVSFSEVDGNAAVKITVPAGMKKVIADVFSDANGEGAVETFNNLTIAQALEVVSFMDADHISAAYADEIEMIVDMACEMEALVNKVVANVSSATINVNGVDIALLADGARFDIASKDMAGLVLAASAMLNSDGLANVKLGDFQNADGTYTIECEATIKGITEKVSITFDVF